MKSGTTYSQGDLILVPFPFTDLSATKRRPAIIVSPDHFHRTSEDVVLVAVTSQTPPRLSDMELALTQNDIVFGKIPRPSIVKLAKLFTMHQRLIVRRVARLREGKLTEVLDRLRCFFSRKPQLMVREGSAGEPGRRVRRPERRRMVPSRRGSRRQGVKKGMR